MAFFTKLKERLFKSQAKLDQGLDELVSEGADEAPTEAATPDEAPAAQEYPESVSAPEAAPLQLDEPVTARPVEPVAPGRADAGRADAGHVDPGHANAEQVDAGQVLEEADAPRRGLLARALGRNERPTRVLDDAMLESLEDVLIQADMGVETAMELSARLSERHYGRRVDTEALKRLLAEEITAVLEPVAVPLPLYAKRPQVVLVVGVNGAGKTTTIGKLASQLTDAGKKVVIAACDTFRAAAVEQLQVWGNRAGVPVLTAPQGSDPASLAFEAFVRAEDDGADLLLVDTAGRLQNRQDLMEELAKIVRVLRKKDVDAPHNTVLVLDATVGQNALSQVETFAKIADVSGLVMTKLDGTAKGGVLVALAARFGLPIHAIGVGEQIDDLQSFDAGEFAVAITGAAA
ncbi:MAG: signal recognition particle-docking protein FtsY [Pseudomonadota bacterium]